MKPNIQSHPSPYGRKQRPGDPFPAKTPASGEGALRRRGSLLGWLAGLVALVLGALPSPAQQSPAGCTGSGLGIDLFAQFGDVHIGDTLLYSVRVFNSPFPACDASGIQAGIVTPDGVTNSITSKLVRRALAPGESDYYTDIVSYVVRAQDIRPDGTLRATAFDNGDIHQNDTFSRGGGNQGVNTEVNQPCVLITAVCVPGVGENGLINFTGTVVNCGNNTLVGVTVTNFVNNGAFTVLFPTTLAIGQVAPFSGSWIPANPCGPNTAVLTVRASDEFTRDPHTVTNVTTVICQNALTPGIKVTKTCPVLPVAPGELLTFTGSVSNSGNVTLTNIVVVNDRPAANTRVFTLAFLAPGEVAPFSGSYLAPTNCTVSDTLIATANSQCGVPVSSTASATCPIQTTPQILVTATCPATPVLPGAALTYTGTVRNTGNITLTGVVVVSDQPVPNTPVFTVASLAPGASANFTRISTAPASACSVVTTFSATGKDQCTQVLASNSAVTTCGVVTAPGIAVTLACPPTASATGAPITYTGTVRNSGNVALMNVFVVNNQPGPNTPVIGPISLAPGASANFVTTFAATLDACAVSSTVTATATDDCSGNPVSNSATATCALLTAPSLVVSQDCPLGPVVPGSLLTYSGNVRNSGNITLTNVIVLNNRSGTVPIFTAATLAPGEAAAYSGSYLATTNCSSTSISTATGRSICGIAVTHSVTSTCTITTEPQISITAACPVNPVLPGGVLTYTGTVRNTGNMTLTNVVVVSDQPAPNTTVFSVAALAPGASANFTRVFTAPANACSITTVFTANARDFCSLTPVSNSASTICSVVTAPGIAVTLACPATLTASGVPMTFTGTVRNSGNVALQNVFVVNNQPGANTPVIGPITLAPGATVNFVTTFSAPLDACSVSSTVTATGTDDCSGNPVSNSATATCPLTTAPAVVLTQVCAAPAVPGSLLTYSGTVRNSGNVTLTNVVIVNNLSGTTPIFTAATLAPGETAAFTGSYVASLACSSSSTSVVTGRSICGVAVTHSASSVCPILTTPAIVVTQICPTTPVLQGGILTYSGTVSNAGNITLTNVMVMNNHPASNTLVFRWNTLAPGATERFSGSYNVPTNCCVVSSTVRASGQGCEGVTVTDSATRTCTVQTLPRIVVTKVCPPLPLRPGELLTYSGTVSNAGNITLINVGVVNNHAPNDPLIPGDLTLAPGEWAAYSGSYIVPENSCGTDTVTATGTDVCTFIPVVSTIVSTCPIITSDAALAITKNCPLLPTPRGGLYTFSGSVSNSGTITLVNVYVVDNQPTNNTPVLGPITLAPGASMDFSGSYTAPKCCCYILDTLTARAQVNCTGSNLVATATAFCPLLTVPGITVVPDCGPAPIQMGSLYRFSGYVTNTGEAVLTNVFVFGPQGPNSVILGPFELARGEAKSYSGTYTVPFDTCNVSVTASGQDTCGGSVVTHTGNCPVEVTRGLSVTQACPSIPVPLGSPVGYSGVVRNTGNITLNNVMVFDSRPGFVDPIFGPISLAPGASLPFTGSYTSLDGASLPAHTVTAVALDACQIQSLAAAADCLGPVVPQPVPALGATTLANGVVGLSIRTEAGKLHAVQYKNGLSDPSWRHLKTVVGTGGILSIQDEAASANPTRFYRVTSSPR